MPLLGRLRVPLDGLGPVLLHALALRKASRKTCQLDQPGVITCPPIQLVHGLGHDLRMRRVRLLTQPGQFLALYLRALICGSRPRGALELARVSFALEHGLQTDTRDGRLRLKVDTQIYSEKLPKEKLTPNFRVEILGFDTHIFTTT